MSKKRHSVKRRPLMTGGRLTEELRPRNESKPRGKYRVLAEAQADRADEFWRTGIASTDVPLVVKKPRHLKLVESKPEPEELRLGEGPDSGKRGFDYQAVERAMTKGKCVRCLKMKRKSRKKHPLCATCLRELRNRRLPMEEK